MYLMSRDTHPSLSEADARSRQKKNQTFNNFAFEMLRWSYFICAFKVHLLKIHVLESVIYIDSKWNRLPPTINYAYSYLN